MNKRKTADNKKKGQKILKLRWVAFCLGFGELKNWVYIEAMKRCFCMVELTVHTFLFFFLFGFLPSLSLLLFGFGFLLIQTHTYILFSMEDLWGFSSIEN